MNLFFVNQKIFKYRRILGYNITKMKKVIFAVIGILAAFFILSFFKDILIKSAVERGAEMVTGLKLDIRSLSVDIARSIVNVKGLVLYNPKGFKDEVMLDMPEIYVDYDLPAIIKGNVRLREMRLHLKELVVVKNEKGELNLDALKAVRAIKKGKDQREEARSMPEIQIDDLRLKAGRAVYKDYSRGSPPSVREFVVNLDERYTNIRDPYSLVSLIIVRTLNNTSISNLAGFDIGGLSKSISGSIASARDMAIKAAGAARETMKKTAEDIKKTAEGLQKVFETR